MARDRRSSASTKCLRERCSQWRAAACTITSKAVSFATRRRATGASRISRRWPKITPACCECCAASQFFAPTEGSTRRSFPQWRTCVPSCAIRQTGFFAGSQDADEAYFALPLDERRRHERTFRRPDLVHELDVRTSSAPAAWWRARSTTTSCCAQACARTRQRSGARSRRKWALLSRAGTDGTPEVRDLFTDQVAYLRALLDAHEISGEPRFIARAQALAAATSARFAAPDGGFFDRAGDGEALGDLIYPDRPIVDNGLFADALLRLSALTSTESYRQSGATRCKSTTRRRLGRVLRGDICARGDALSRTRDVSSASSAIRKPPTAFARRRCAYPTPSSRFARCRRHSLRANRCRPNRIRPPTFARERAAANRCARLPKCGRDTTRCA